MSQPVTPENFPIWFPFVFAGMWIGVTTLLGLLSGWFGLMSEFPDREEKGELIKSVKVRSAGMGIGVNLRGILILEVFERGLRLKILRIFGPFQKPVFIPWDEIRIERKQGGIMGRRANLIFGKKNPLSKMTVEVNVADELWRAAGRVWPEVGSVPEPISNIEVLKKVFRRWLFSTAFAATFFTLAPRFLISRGLEKNADNFPPMALTILFPAIVFGIGAVVQYISETRRK